MTFWNTVTAVIVGLTIYSVIDFVADTASNWLMRKRNAKQLAEFQKELEEIWLTFEKEPLTPKKRAAKKATTKKKP